MSYIFFQSQHFPMVSPETGTTKFGMSGHTASYCSKTEHLQWVWSVTFDAIYHDMKGLISYQRPTDNKQWHIVAFICTGNALYWICIIEYMYYNTASNNDHILYSTIYHTHSVVRLFMLNAMYKVVFHFHTSINIVKNVLYM